MIFDNIFNVFSRRDKPIDPFIYKVPKTLRTKIFLFCKDTFNNSQNDFSGQDYTQDFWNEIHKSLLYRHGRAQLVGNNSPLSPAEDTITFLFNCEDEEFLDFVEYIFRVKSLFHVATDENILISNLNKLFVSENAGFELTEMVKEKVVEAVNEYPFFGDKHTVIKTIAYPQIIKKDNQAIHTTIIKPVFNLLNDPKYKTANQEYLEALKDYKKGDYGDCLTKCCSAFESVMKIICNNKSWSYKQNDTAGTLINIIIDNTGLDSYFKDPLTIIATLRNRLSTSHGAGTSTRVVSENLANYALNSTASAIILMINEAK